jgi:hypothetical protein
MRQAQHLRIFRSGRGSPGCAATRSTYRGSNTRARCSVHSTKAGGLAPA